MVSSFQEAIFSNSFITILENLNIADNKDKQTKGKKTSKPSVLTQPLFPRKQPPSLIVEGPTQTVKGCTSGNIRTLGPRVDCSSIMWLIGMASAFGNEKSPIF